jgi:hypothetical protein
MDLRRGGLKYSSQFDAPVSTTEEVSAPRSIAEGGLGHTRTTPFYRSCVFWMSAAPVDIPNG